MAQKKDKKATAPKKGRKRLGFKTKEHAEQSAKIVARAENIDPMVAKISEALTVEGGTPLETNAPADPAILMFTVQLALAGGNPTEAGRAIGWSPQRSRAVIKKWPVLVDIARDAAAQVASSAVKKWGDMADEMRAHLRELALNADDERVQLQGTLAVIERIEGKVPAKIEVEDTTPADIWASVVTRFATSYHVAKNVTFAEAMAVAESNPDGVREWGIQHGLIGS